MIASLCCCCCEYHFEALAIASGSKNLVGLVVSNLIEGYTDSASLSVDYFNEWKFIPENGLGNIPSLFISSLIFAGTEGIIYRIDSYESGYSVAMKLRYVLNA